VKADWLKMELVDCSKVILNERGPMKILDLVDAIKNDKRPGYSNHIYCVLTPSSLSGLLRSYGCCTNPPVTFMKMRIGSHIWYLEGDDRIGEFSKLAAGTAVKKNPNQVIIDAIDYMLNWYKHPEEDW
jgi:hypothetical protein